MKRMTLLSIVCGLVVAIVGITIAYAATELSSNLSITTSKITQSQQTWNVGFTGSSATATVGGTSDTGRSCGTASITPTTVTVANTSLSKPNDSCTYALTVANTGTIAAKLNNIVPTAPSGDSCGTLSGPTMICGNITYKLTSNAAGTTPLATNTVLAASTGTQSVYLVVTYTGDDVVSTAVNQSGASFSLVYGQN